MLQRLHKGGEIVGTIHEEPLRSLIQDGFAKPIKPRSPRVSLIDEMEDEVLPWQTLHTRSKRSFLYSMTAHWQQAAWEQCADNDLS